MEEETLGAWIRRRREQHGWTQGELADLAGVGALSISRYERGVAKPRADTLQRLTKLLAGGSDQPPFVTNEERLLAGQREILGELRALRQEVSGLRGVRLGAAPRELPSPEETADGMAELERSRKKPQRSARRSRRGDRPDASPNPGPAKP